MRRRESMIEYFKYLAYAITAMIAVYFIFRLAGERAVSGVVQQEVEQVLNSEEHKVKGRFE